MGVYTTNINMYKPDSAETGYDDEVNDSFDGLDNLFGASGTHNHSGDAGHGATIELPVCGGTIVSAQLPDSGAMATLFATTILADTGGLNHIQIKSNLDAYSIGVPTVATFNTLRAYGLGGIGFGGTLSIVDNIIMTPKTLDVGTIFATLYRNLGTFSKQLFSNFGFNIRGISDQSVTVGDGDYSIGTCPPNSNTEIFKIAFMNEPGYNIFKAGVELKVTAGGTALVRIDLHGTEYNSEVSETFYTNDTHDSWAWEEWVFTNTDETGTVAHLSVMGTVQDTGGTMYIKDVYIDAIRTF